MAHQTSSPEQITKSGDPGLQAAPAWPVSLRSLCLVLAYIHRFRPPLLPRRRFLPPAHLRQVAVWIGRPAPELRSIRAHRPLLVHFTLLQAAGLLHAGDAALLLDTGVTDWLHMPAPSQLELLLAAQQSPAWHDTLSKQGWQTVLGCEYDAYVQQSLHSQLAAAPATGEGGVDQIIWADTQLTMELGDHLPLWLLFDLLQLGNWQPGQPLSCTPQTINQAAARGYGQPLLEWLLATATGQRLTPPQRARLDYWLRQGRAHRLQAVLLLETAQPNQLEAILKQARFKPYTKAQISPRHAIVSSDLSAQLQNWLQEQGYHLQLPPHHAATALAATPPANGASSDLATPEQISTEYQWLGLRLLIGLGELIPLPYPAPFALLERVGEQLSPWRYDDLEAKARQLLQQLRHLVRGQDAFLPAPQPVDQKLIDTVQTAIARQQPLDVHYQSPADYEPRYRRIQPVRLEQRGTLYYLYAYCYRAEADLVFRLDRISELGA